MKAQIGILLLVPLIVILFRLARERNGSSSKALWIPLIWLAIGFALYFLYGRRHSALRAGVPPPPSEVAP